MAPVYLPWSTIKNWRCERMRAPSTRLLISPLSRGSDQAISDRREATFCLEAILTSEPFRERPGTDPYLCAPEHGTEEPDLRDKVPFWMSPRFAPYDYLALGGPEQSPLWRKVCRLDQIGRTKIIAALAHSDARIPPDSLCCVPQEIRPSQLAFDENRTRSGSPADHVGILIRWCGKFVEHHGALSAEPAHTHRN